MLICALVDAVFASPHTHTFKPYAHNARGDHVLPDALDLAHAPLFCLAVDAADGTELPAAGGAGSGGAGAVEGHPAGTRAEAVLPPRAALPGRIPQNTHRFRLVTDEYHSVPTQTPKHTQGLCTLPKHTHGLCTLPKHTQGL